MGAERRSESVEKEKFVNEVLKIGENDIYLLM